MLPTARADRALFERYICRPLHPLSMNKAGFDESMCDECGQPLFLTVAECKAFIEKKLQEGFIVCSCCGSEKGEKKAD